MSECSSIDSWQRFFCDNRIAIKRALTEKSVFSNYLNSCFGSGIAPNVEKAASYLKPIRAHEELSVPEFQPHTFVKKFYYQAPARDLGNFLNKRAVFLAESFEGITIDDAYLMSRLEEHNAAGGSFDARTFDKLRMLLIKKAYDYWGLGEHIKAFNIFDKLNRGGRDFIKTKGIMDYNIGFHFDDASSYSFRMPYTDEQELVLDDMIAPVVPVEKCIAEGRIIIEPKEDRIIKIGKELKRRIEILKNASKIDCYGLSSGLESEQKDGQKPSPELLAELKEKQESWHKYTDKEFEGKKYQSDRSSWYNRYGYGIFRVF